ncbi:MAG: nucleotidyl transferase AbiEii/AbiGii toxin family protein [Candidatus Pseudobacter hemicellulosilyticus]|uniref:Nucleotidyl transferase AbiEii/AbiGii toxin family protein n=1 Tax=Candidatus Pseudobacter hemicellulosilyticus TaxID=3121375 RepID=A0AAJ6BET8_9BACT|nr:MAG: nucleotidyl transferase AbiEii/AbiGii toxin family protein [Pseudobacter sp.]
MAAIYLHDHSEFQNLLNILWEESGILPGLIEKDYWIMHCLYGLKKQGYVFQLKGGTSLSKGLGLIDRFSEDIDMHINPPAELGINENPKNQNEKNIQKKKDYYDQLAGEITIAGIIEVKRDTDFDDKNRYNSGGIRLIYQQQSNPVEGVKEGILLEAGYDNVAPNMPLTISSWAYERAKNTFGIDIIDNRAVDILCYDHRYTFVEKLQTIATKFRKEMETGQVATNYMRQYYDVYSLLGDGQVQEFIGSGEYLAHKEKRFPGDDLAIPVNKNEAFLLNDKSIREKLQKRYESTKALYYKGQPPFEEVLNRIQRYIDKL